MDRYNNEKNGVEYLYKIRSIKNYELICSLVYFIFSYYLASLVHADAQKIRMNLSVAFLTVGVLQFFDACFKQKYYFFVVSYYELA